MPIAAWSARLSAAGASPTEVAAITGSYNLASGPVQAALDTIIGAVGTADIATMLTAWRLGSGPFYSALPGGGLPFGTKVALLTGSAGDDIYPVSAGTGQKMTSAVSVAAGASPGARGYRTFPQVPDYVANVVGTGIGLINTTTGTTDYSASSGDHAAVIQQAINALHAAGNGGVIDLTGGTAQFSTQLVLYDGMALRGSLVTGSYINTTYAGSAIVCTASRSASYWMLLRDVLIQGNNAAGQNGVEYNASGGYNPMDCQLENVFVDGVGQYGYVLGGGGSNSGVKLFMDRCYAEYCGSHGIYQTDSKSVLSMDQCFVQGNNGSGYVQAINQIIFFRAHNCFFGLNALTGLTLGADGNTSNSVVGCHIYANTRQGILIPSGAPGVGAGTFNDNEFDGNGGASYPQVDIQFSNTSFTIVGNRFFAGTGLVNHIRAQSANPMVGVIADNTFRNTITGLPILMTSNANNAVVIKNNSGLNDIYGKIATPFNASTHRIGLFGSAAAPVASTDYWAEGTDLYVGAFGGTGVSITIKDWNGNALQSGNNFNNGVLPNGYGINFGAFSVAPTVNVSVT